MNQATTPAAHGLTQQGADHGHAWTGTMPSSEVPDNAVIVYGTDGRSEVWTEGDYVYRRNVHSSNTIAVYFPGKANIAADFAKADDAVQARLEAYLDREAEQADMDAKAERLRQLTQVPVLTSVEAEARQLLDIRKPVFDSAPARLIRTTFWSQYAMALTPEQIRRIGTALMNWPEDDFAAADLTTALSTLVRAKILRSRMDRGQRVYELNFAA